ncbi:MAG: flagellar basal body rod protein FlgB [Nitrospinales bacterium]
MLIDRILFSDKTPLLLKKNLDFQSQRNLLIAGNISNVNTPGFKAQDVRFEDQLRDAVESKDKLVLKTTHEKHFGPSKDSIKKMQPEVFEEVDAARSDGNNVNIDKEMLKLAETQIKYNATIQIMAKRGSTVRAAVSETIT